MASYVTPMMGGVNPANAHLPLPPPPSRGSSRTREGMAEISVSTTGITTTAPTISANTLSSPFSHGGPSTYQAMAGSRGVSPMGTRLTVGPYNTQYNPQQWSQEPEQMELHGQQLRRSTQTPRLDAGMENPPPPYSQQVELNTRNGSTRSSEPFDHATPNVGTPQSSAKRLSSEQYSRQRPVSMMQFGPGVARASQPVFAAPPTSRSSSSSSVTSRFGQFLPGFGSGAHQREQSHNTQGGFDPTGPANLNDGGYPIDDLNGLAPGSRRALSADALLRDAGRTASQPSLARLSQNRNWPPAMHLPGPPSAPPPAASRSSSVEGVGNASAAQLLRPTPKAYQAPTLGTRLEPPPPTPAEWRPDEERDYTKTPTLPQAAQPPGDESGSRSGAPHSVKTITSAGGFGLARSAAKRDPSAKGIRERRRASGLLPQRTSIGPDGQEGAVLSIAALSAPQTQSPNEVATVRQSQESTPTTALEHPPSEENLASLHVKTPGDSNFPHAADIDRPKTRYSGGPLNGQPAPTPPLSPGRKVPQLRLKTAATGGSTKTLPTPPSTTSVELHSTNFRPMSHILHLPNDDNMLSTYFWPQEPSRVSKPLSTDTTCPTSDSELLASLARHKDFMTRELTANTAEEKLRIFSEYILCESSIRRKKYSSLFAKCSFDIAPVRARLFEQADIPPQSHSRSISTANSLDMSTEPITPASLCSNTHDAQWGINYQPALSPIASMSHDEGSSRGRTSSRWWESQTGSDGGGLGQKTHRTKRESKYMGLSREAINAEMLALSAATEQPSLDGSRYADEKSNPEEFGCYDGYHPSLNLGQHSKQRANMSKIDVSRFITLPPPYPRHYPAVNNSHPALNAYRTVVRTSTDLSEIMERKSRSAASAEALRKRHAETIKANRQTFQTNICCQVADGSISYAEAAEAEEAMKRREHELEKKLAQEEYDSFQDVVLNPLHTMLHDRVASLNASLQQLQDMLFSEAQAGNLDQTQEEGDEEPELLEKLTQFKWLFESREQMHKEIFQLLSDRNEKFKRIVLLPYKQMSNTAKLKNTEEFFAQDARDRKVTFYRECLERCSAFLQVIEVHVRRGVELQSCTYWDIVPGLLDVLQRVPNELRNFEGVHIPDEEYSENPSYHHHPLQYLYSLMTHAEKSTYQFIESQTNLQCLLHEVKTGLASSRCKFAQAECERDGGHSVALEDLADRKLGEEAVLTSELRQATSMVEEQWWESLGSQLQEAMHRVKCWLVENGGWEDMERQEE